ncbi:MAG: SoxR reducing system RseC family protein [Bacteroidales bacterium]|nr:SoxR reducing system RseC family protein [Bacteroidales bacterium]
MAGKAEISHPGKVLQITPTQVLVQIEARSACASCHASALCGMSESEQKIVSVPASLRDDYLPGQEVDVVLKASMGHKAVWLAYCIPLVVLLAVMFTALKTGASELAAAGLGICATAIYYFVIWLLRDRLRNEYNFIIRKRLEI